MRWLVAVVVTGVVLVVLAVAGALPFTGEDEPTRRAAPAASRVDRFDSRAAFRLLEQQVRLGPRPAGSPASRALARRLRLLLPRSSYQAVPGGLRNVVGRVRGRDSGRFVVLGAHYDTKDVPDFVGANDGASGTAIVTQLARTIRPRRLRPSVVFILFDGEESPAGTPDEEFEARGLRGSKVAAARYRRAEAMILLDFVGEKRLRVPREQFSNPRLWRRLRAAAKEVGAARTFPARTQPAILDDHVPFLRRGVPSIDLIDFDFACFHKPCDNLSVVSERSVDAVGETVLELLASL